MATTKQLTLELIVWALVLATIGVEAKQKQRVQSPACLDEDGKRVDWYVGYKLPYLANEQHPIKSGYAYMYFTSEDAARAGQAKGKPKSAAAGENDGFMTRFRSTLLSQLGFPAKGQTKRARLLLEDSVDFEEGLATAQSMKEAGKMYWKLSKHLLTDPESMMMRTLAVAYDNEDVNAVFYSDDPNMTEEEAAARRELSRQNGVGHRARVLERQKAAAAATAVAAERKPRKPRAAPRKRKQEPVEVVAIDDDDDEDSGIGSDSESGDGDAAEGKQKKKKKSSKKAHAKGVLLIDDDNDDGVWLTHSIPQFPPHLHRGLSWPQSSFNYGQTFMCISFGVKETSQQLIKHLVNMNPGVYEYAISDKLSRRFPEIVDLDPENRRRKTRVDQLQQQIRTKAGEALDLFSKSPDWYGDLYSDWIDEAKQTNMFAETWRQGQGIKLESTCPADEYHVNNIKDMNFYNDAGDRISWTYNHDHSKWAISETSNKGFFCIADTNRMESQFRRGSGAVCMDCPGCWQVFSNTIHEVEPCPVAKKPKRQLDPKTKLAIDWQWVNALRKHF